MTDRLPINDSKELVKHTRQAVLAMLLVTAVVTVGVLSRNTERVSRALQQAEIVVGLMEYFREMASRSDHALHLTPILLGSNASGVKDISSFEFSMKRVDDSQSAEAVVLDSVRCVSSFNLSDYLFVENNNFPKYINLSETASDEFEILSGVFGSGGFIWEPSPNVPRSVGEFKKFWDVLVESDYALKIDDILVKHAYMTKYYYNINKEFYYFVDDANSIKLNKIDFDVESGIAVAENYNKAPKEDKWAPDFGFELPPSVLLLWTENEVGAFTQANCIEPSQSSAGNLRVPVKYSYVRVNWVGSWIQQAREGGFVGSDFRPVRDSFETAFSDLSTEAAGLESVDFVDVRNWLQQREISEGQAVTIFSVQIPAAILRISGIALIVVMQIYVFVHLCEVRRRLELSQPGDPGSFEPWIALYDTKLSRGVTRLTFMVPAAASVVVTLKLALGGSVLGLPALVATVGFAASLIVFVMSLPVLRQIQLLAGDHRASFAQNGQ